MSSDNQVRYSVPEPLYVTAAAAADLEPEVISDDASSSDHKERKAAPAFNPKKRKAAAPAPSSRTREKRKIVKESERRKTAKEKESEKRKAVKESEKRSNAAKPEVLSGPKSGRWSNEEKQAMLDALMELVPSSINWETVATRVGRRSVIQCQTQWRRNMKQELTKIYT
ncbi:hypothetical protein BC936DRAFT_148882 [Jimgerdemannia flammicorona]|uniref:Myb-like domain-containing protein n=1 Tax=Jimgerdemannia flammicorona TaxID=994334 RepID=A0A433D231_9FUNG|nr:hypothetical protein BC936DRAFT_148882 [Jimgerdemannia flammicorona]